MDLKTIIMNSLFFGIGAVSMTREKVEEWVSELVKRGEMSGGEGRRLSGEINEAMERARREIDARIQRGTRSAAEALNLATKQEVAALEAEITVLRRELDGMHGKSPRRTGRRKRTE